MRKVVLMEYLDNGLKFFGLQRIPSEEEMSEKVKRFRDLTRDYPKKVNLNEFYSKLMGDTFPYARIEEKDIERAKMPSRIKVSLLDELKEKELA